MHPYTRRYAHRHGGRHGSGGGIGYTCMNKYTDRNFQLLTTTVTDKNKRY